MAPPSHMATLDSDIFKCCHKVITLGWANDVEAKRLLQDAADQVKPIMARRKWAVPLLTEFYPSAPHLLGLNQGHGMKIFVRLRSPSDRNTFLPYESILGTLLHELVHIEVGPHNAKFYALLDELQHECDQLIAKGNNGKSGTPPSSFEGTGNKLGGWAAQNVPRRLASKHAAQAAQRRQRVASIMSHGSGGRLGGGTAEIARLCDPREMALAAAERRRLDDIRCGSHRDDIQVSDTEAPSVIVIDDEVVEHDNSQRNLKRKTEIIVISDDEDQAGVKEMNLSGNSSSQLRSGNNNDNMKDTQRPASITNIPTRQTAAARAAMKRAQRRQER